MRAKRRGNGAEKVAAARAAAVERSRSRDVGAHPLTAGLAERIDALHGEAGQVLHRFSLSGRITRDSPSTSKEPQRPAFSTGNRRAPGGQAVRRLLTSMRGGPGAATRSKNGGAREQPRDGANCAAAALWCQEEIQQDIVVGLQAANNGTGAPGGQHPKAPSDQTAVSCV